MGNQIYTPTFLPNIAIINVDTFIPVFHLHLMSFISLHK